MRTIRKLAAASMTIAALAVAGIGSAHADPINGRNAVHFLLTCNGEKLEVVSPSEPSAAVHIVGGNSVLIAANATLVTTFTDPQSGQVVSQTQNVVFGAGHGQAQGLQEKSTTCTNTLVVDDPVVGPITATLTGTFVLTPRRP